jgi:hypothetical protein
MAGTSVRCPITGRASMNDWLSRLVQSLRSGCESLLFPRELEVARARVNPRPSIVRRTRAGDEYRL